MLNPITEGGMMKQYRTDGVFRPTTVLALAIVFVASDRMGGDVQAQQASSGTSAAAAGICWTCVDTSPGPCQTGACMIVTNIWGYLTCIEENSDVCNGGCLVDESSRCMIIWALHLDGSVVPAGEAASSWLASTSEHEGSTLGMVGRGCRNLILDRRYDESAAQMVREATGFIEL